MAIVKRSGEKRTLSETFASLQGVAWPPGGKEVWFSAATVGFNRALHAVTRSGRHRVLARATGGLVLQDVAKDGRVLVTQEKSRQELSVRLQGDAKERDLSWLDWSLVTDISDDGRTILFDESGEGGGKGYSVYVRKTDGSPAVRLGEGSAQALSPDTRWVLAIADSTSDPKLVAYPTGAGQPRSFPKDGLSVQDALWFPDGKRIFFNGRERGHGVRCYVQSVDAGPPRPLLPEGIAGHLVSPDGKIIAAVDVGEGKVVFFSAEGQPIALPHDLPSGNIPAAFSADSRFLFAFGWGQIPTPVYRLDLASGKKQLWKELAPVDRSGVDGMAYVRLSADGRSYAYCYTRCLNDLYLVKGLK